MLLLLFMVTELMIIERTCSVTPSWSKPLTRSCYLVNPHLVVLDWSFLNSLLKLHLCRMWKTAKSSAERVRAYRERLKLNHNKYVEYKDKDNARKKTERQKVLRPSEISRQKMLNRERVRKFRQNQRAEMANQSPLYVWQVLCCGLCQKILHWTGTWGRW